MTTRDFMFAGVDLVYARVCQDGDTRKVIVDTDGFDAVSASYTHVAGTIGAAVVRLRKANSPNDATGADYSVAVSLNSTTTTTAMQLIESRYVVLETTTATGASCIVNLHVHLRRSATAFAVGT